jgi:hypothetical protein
VNAYTSPCVVLEWVLIARAGLQQWKYPVKIFHEQHLLAIHYYCDLSSLRETCGMDRIVLTRYDI